MLEACVILFLMLGVSYEAHLVELGLSSLDRGVQEGT